MSKIGQAIQEMEDMGIEPIQENLKLYVELKKAQKKYVDSPRVSHSSQNKLKEKTKKV